MKKNKSSERIKILHICTEAIGGGASRAASLLHLALIKNGVSSRLLASEPTNLPHSSCWNPDLFEKNKLRKITLKKVWSNRKKNSNTHFSLDLLGAKISSHPWVRDADVIHLHWVADFLSSLSLMELACLNKPIFWTLHDMRPLSGGCHFTAGCDRFRSGCHQCPQLIRNRPPITFHAWRALREAIQVADVKWIGPSRWICKMANMAKVARPEMIHHIPYGIDRYAKPLRPQAEARRLLGLPLGQMIILIASSDIREKRKGADLAKKILAKVRRSKKQNINVSVVVVGQHSKSFACQGWQIHSLGKLDRDRMNLVYRASDILLFPSLEDNLPLVLLEAIAHELLPVASSVGGVPDLFPKEEFSQLLFSPNKPENGAKKLLRLLESRSLRRRLRKTMMQRARRLGSWTQQANSHKALYLGSIKNKNHSAKNPAKSTHREGGAVSFPLFTIWVRMSRLANRLFLSHRICTKMRLKEAS